MPPGSFFGPLEVLLEGLAPAKSITKLNVYEVFTNAGFRYFACLLGPPRAHLGPLLGRSDPKIPPQKWSKKCSETGLKNDTKQYPKFALLGSQNEAQNYQKSLARGTGKPPRRPKMALRCAKAAPRCAKMSPRWPRIRKWLRIFSFPCQSQSNGGAP